MEILQTIINILGWIAFAFGYVGAILFFIAILDAKDNSKYFKD